MNTQISEIGSTKMAAARLSIWSNATLTIVKLVVGAATGSIGVLSEAAHSATDLVASGIAFFAVRASDRPADPDHPYGHGKIESLSGMAEAMLVFGAGAFIIYEAISSLSHGDSPHRVDFGIAVMIASAMVNALISVRLMRVAKETDSPALEADAVHLRADVWTSLGVLLGLSATAVTHIRWIDSAVALGVATLILRAAWKLSQGALLPLIDTSLPDSDVEAIRGILNRSPHVLGYHKLRTRKSGAERHVDAHVLMRDDLSLLESHRITEELEDEMRVSLPNVEVTLHTEPFMEERAHQREKHGRPHSDEVLKDPII